jgi:aconitate hydratase
VQSNYLASPPLVVAYAFAGTTDINLLEEAIAENKEGKKIYLQDIWPSNKEITEIVQQTVTRESFIRKYKDVFNGDKYWQQISSSNSITYNWSDSTYINNPPYFKDMQIATTPVKDINNAKIIAILGDSVTTDHISPAGNIAANSPAAKYLRDKNVVPADFNSYGSRRGNHEIMMRGTFANIRIRNEMLDNVEGGYTLDPQTNEVVSIYDAAMKHKNSNTPLVVVAGKEYGTGSSRDWAAKGTRLLGINAVIAESFERIHRSNLIGMGVLPLMFVDGENRKTLNLTGHETFNLLGIDNLAVAKRIQAEITYQDGKIKPIELLCRIDTATELEYYLNDGILPYMIRHLLKD